MHCHDSTELRWNDLEFKVEEEIKKWKKESMVGKLHNANNLDMIKEHFILGGLSFIRIRYIGDKKFS